MGLNTQESWGATADDLVAAFGARCVAEASWRTDEEGTKMPSPPVITQSIVDYALAVARDEIWGLMWRCFTPDPYYPCDGFIIQLHADLTLFYLEVSCGKCREDTEEHERRRAALDKRLAQLCDGKRCIGGVAPRCKTEYVDPTTIGPSKGCSPGRVFTHDTLGGFGLSGAYPEHTRVLGRAANVGESRCSGCNQLLTRCRCTTH